MDWQVWGNGSKPLFEGSEAEVKRFVEDSEENGDLYIQGPQGQELMYENERWVPTT